MSAIAIRASGHGRSDFRIAKNASRHSLSESTAEIRAAAPAVVDQANEGGQAEGSCHENRFIMRLAAVLAERDDMVERGAKFVFRQLSFTDEIVQMAYERTHNFAKAGVRCGFQFRENGVGEFQASFLGRRAGKDFGDDYAPRIPGEATELKAFWGTPPGAPSDCSSCEKLSPNAVVFPPSN